MVRIRKSRADYYRKWRSENRAKVRAYKREHPEPEKPPIVIGIDGEGITDPETGAHVYRYLAACSEDELICEVENVDGITAIEAFEFLFEIREQKSDSMLVGFSLGYDYTKWLEKLPTDVIYHLVRPETRRGKHGARPVKWGRYLLNYLRGKFTITRALLNLHRPQCKDSECDGCKHGDSVTVWDVWGFFQGSFIDACLKWAIITTEEHALLKEMKGRRSTFSEADWAQVKSYCLLECRKLARLVTRLREAHVDAGLPLTSYYGAGSTATVLMKKMGIKDYLPTGDYSEELRYAIACGFFGGRFEINRIGPLRKPTWSYDIASAYPYQLFQLPCLACGNWRHVKGRKVHNEIVRAQYALIRYKLPYCKAIKVVDGTSDYPWGPFPMRTQGLDEIDDGCIVYPVTSGGGWVYREEYLSAKEGWPNVKAIEAWIYETSCDHHPFKDLPQVYAERLRWGKDGPGIVLKLGPNSCYGKIAQSIGDAPPFQCFAWAGMITSGCRGQLTTVMRQNLDAIVMTATDGIVSDAELKVPKPIDTGTFEAAAKYGKEPLGAWECKHNPGGVMLIRPGIAFPLTGKEEETKARGVGKAVLTKFRDMVMQSWEENGPKAITLSSTIFRGMKSSTGMAKGEYTRAKEYGTWVPRTTAVSYMPEPKRPFMLDGERLHTWAFNQEVTSAPYARILGQKGSVPAEVDALKEIRDMMLEQPDGAESWGDEF